VSIYDLTENQIIVFALVLIRCTGFVMTMPVLSLTNIPGPIKVLLCLILTTVIFPVLPGQAPSTELINTSLIWLVMREAVLGLILGFVSRCFFFAISICGQLLAMSMGLANAQVFNPAMGGQTTSLETFQTTVATLFFLTINGHLILIRGLHKSFDLIPLSARGLEMASLSTFVEKGGEIIVLGVQLALPIVMAIFFMNVAMGIIGRAVPQINVLITSIPVNVLVGFTIMIMTTPIFFSEVGDLVQRMAEELFLVMRVI
jgi:flagellar biosynthetic protein FliR